MPIVNPVTDPAELPFATDMPAKAGRCCLLAMIFALILFTRCRVLNHIATTRWCVGKQDRMVVRTRFIAQVIYLKGDNLFIDSSKFC